MSRYRSSTAASIANVPSGNIISTTVQSAISELDSNKLQASGSHKITVGTVQPTVPSVGDLWVDTS